MKNTITLRSNVSEKDLIEYCCNLYHAGYEYNLFLAFHALVHGWKLSKFTYYVRIIKERLNRFHYKP